MTYYFTDEFIIKVVELEDGKTQEWFIPKEPKNSDYQEYLAWAAVKSNKATAYPNQ